MYILLAQVASAADPSAVPTVASLFGTPIAAAGLAALLTSLFVKGRVDGRWLPFIAAGIAHVLLSIAWLLGVYVMPDSSPEGIANLVLMLSVLAGGPVATYEFSRVIGVAGANGIIRLLPLGLAVGILTGCVGNMPASSYETPLTRLEARQIDELNTYTTLTSTMLQLREQATAEQWSQWQLAEAAWYDRISATSDALDAGDVEAAELNLSLIGGFRAAARLVSDLLQQQPIRDASPLSLIEPIFTSPFRLAA